MADQLNQLTAHEIRRCILAGQTSAVAVAESCLRRIDEVDSQVEAFVDIWRAPALERAAAIDAAVEKGEDPGPLAGVPIALKDVLCTREGTTTCCSKILEGYRSPFDATVVERMLAAGAVFLGKVNMDEFAMGSSTENSSVKTTRNPWNLEYVPGGSSGGSAASVAADECAVALGSDTGGSIRQPASLCGCVGLKPTYGRVSRYGLVAFASSLDQIGPFGKDVRDAALVLSIIAGRDPKDATSADEPVPDFTQSLTGDVAGLRVGLPKEFFTHEMNVEVIDSVRAAVAKLEEQGAKIVEISLPHTEYAGPVYYIVAGAEASANLARFDGVRYGYRSPAGKNVQSMYHMTKSEGFGDEVQRRILVGTYALSSGYYDAYYLKAQKVRTLIRQDFSQAFEQCDVIATPTSPTAAFKIGERMNRPLDMYLSDILTISVNLAGIPAISLPCGLTRDGLPIGLQLMGEAFDEATLLRAAHAYEQSRGFDLGRPPIA